VVVRNSNPAIFSNNSSAFDNWQFVFDSITQLLITDRIVQVEEHDLIVCSLLSVATQPGGKHAALDPRFKICVQSCLQANYKI
jgi:hypothetical protein